MAIILKVQGAAAAQAVFDLFHDRDVKWLARLGGWYEITITGWVGTAYSALMLAKECYPKYRIYCTTAKTSIPFNGV